jgi:GTP cyclohydrolase I
MTSLSDKDKKRYGFDVVGNCSSKGTPHAQRSRADVKIRFLKESPVWIEDVVEAVEKVLKTPVQIIVKREDEQEFARLNAENPMFVEDSVRLMSDTVDKIEGVLDWSIVANHFESLHAHNAVCVNWKGVPNGLR